MFRRTFQSLALVILLASGLAGCSQSVSAEDEQNDNQAANVALQDSMDRVSYLLGYQQTKSMQEQSRELLVLDAYAAGVRDAATGAASQVANSEREALINALNAAIAELDREASSAIVAEGDALLQENGARPEVTTLASGLQYEVLVEGDGPNPGPSDTVVTHYHGTLPSGFVFDSSVDRGDPATFRVDRVISGWTEALQLMSVGSKWRLVIPSNLAYGERGAGADIPPHATLVFEVELLEIK